MKPPHATDKTGKCSADSAFELKVFISHRDAVCTECREQLGRQAWIVLVPDDRELCLSCADLDHLVFLPSGDAALTRRTKKNSRLIAVVLKWSRARNRYERQGLLVDECALLATEAQCLADADARERRRQRAAVRKAEQDQVFLSRFAGEIRRLFPACPPGRERVIAEHACQKFGSRVGCSASGRRLDGEAVTLAVVAHLRHWETDYDRLLACGWDRHRAREHVRTQIARVLTTWTKACNAVPTVL